MFSFMTFCLFLHLKINVRQISTIKTDRDLGTFCSVARVHAQHLKSPGLDPQYHISPALENQKQEKFKNIFGYIMNLRLAWIA